MICQCKEIESWNMFLIEIYIFCSIVHISCKGAHLWGGKQEQTLLKCGSPKNSK